MLSIPEVRENLPNRCYVCKREMMQAIIREAEHYGYPVVADGTHAGDLPEDRPGMTALRELGIVSPFAEAGMGKDDIVALAADLEIPVRPPSSCLATRIPAGLPLTRECLEMAGRAEALLRGVVTGMLRVRCVDLRAFIEADPSEHPLIIPLLPEIKRLGFTDAVLVPGGYRQGGADAWKR